MRKFLLFCLFLTVLFLFSFTHSPKPAKKIVHSSAAKNHFDPKDWIIDDSVAQRMMDGYRKCNGKCHQSRKQVPNDEVRAYLEQTYNVVGAQQLMGVYSDADVERYKRARKMAAGDPRGNVSGYTTIITQYKVVPKGGFLFAPIKLVYADHYTICPPPDICN